MMAWSLLLNGLVGILAGMIIGIERQWQKKLAGIRTTALVCFGASMFVTLSTLMIGDGSPTRIAAQVVSGVGFLAGGVILRDGYTVTGINTAATLWCSASIGTIIGSGFHGEGLLLAAMLMIVNVVLRGLSYRLDTLDFLHKADVRGYYLSVVCNEQEEISVRTAILHILNQQHLDFNQIICGEAEDGKVTILIDVELRERKAAAEFRIKSLMERLLQEKNILEASRVSLENRE